MADKTTSWHGAVNGSWIVAGNWTNGAPNTDTSNDTLVFLAGAAHAPSSGLDRSADGASGLVPQLVYVKSGVNYTIGTQGNPLIMKPTKIVHRGSQAFYFRAFGTATEVVVNSPNTTLAMEIDADTAALGQVTFLQVSQGHVTVGDRLRIVNLAMVEQRGKMPTSVSVARNASQLIAVAVKGGTLACEAAIANFITVAGGIVRLTDVGVTGGPEIVTVTGGRLTVDVRVSGGSITTLNAVGGITNLLAARANPLAITNYCKFPKARVFKDNDNEIVTITNEYFF